MARMPHDLLIGDPVPVGCRHETCPQPMRADRLGQRALNPGLRRPPEQDLTHGVLTEPAGFDPPGLINLPEHRS